MHLYKVSTCSLDIINKILCGALIASLGKVSVCSCFCENFSRDCKAFCFTVSRNAIILLM